MIVIISSHLLGQILQFKGLSLIGKLGSEQIVPVPFIGHGEFNLVYFVLDHHFACKDVVKGPSISVI